MWVTITEHAGFLTVTQRRPQLLSETRFFRRCGWPESVCMTRMRRGPRKAARIHLMRRPAFYRGLQNFRQALPVLAISRSTEMAPCPALGKAFGKPASDGRTFKSRPADSFIVPG